MYCEIVFMPSSVQWRMEFGWDGWKCLMPAFTTTRVAIAVMSTLGGGVG